MITELIAVLVEGGNLERAQAAAAMQELMGGTATQAQAAAFLTALRMKGETVDEIAGLAETMRAHSLRVSPPFPVIDTCGTGGDGAGSFNISTAAAFVAVAAGLVVAKHGNRSVSSSSGSADVLEALGVAIDLGPVEAEAALRDCGFAFLFAQKYHPAMRHVAPVRREIGIRTVFNFLGPLTNPAGARHQVIGVPNESKAEAIAQALLVLGAERVLVVAGADGVDEITLHGPTAVFDVQPGGVEWSVISPTDAGLASAPLAALRAGSPTESASIIRGVFAGERGPRRDVVVLNAAAALLVGGKVNSIAAGARMAESMIDSGAAGAALERAAAVSTELARASA